MGPDSTGSSPVFPIKYYMESGLCIKFLSPLRINTAKKNLFFKIAINKQELRLLHLLTKRGTVRRFFKLHRTINGKELYIIHPNHTLLTNSNSRVVLFNRRADHLTLSLYALKLINHSTGLSNFILKTDKGLITHQDAIKYHVGGILLCLI